MTYEELKADMEPEKAWIFSMAVIYDVSEDFVKEVLNHFKEKDDCDIYGQSIYTKTMKFISDYIDGVCYC